MTTERVLIIDDHEALADIFATAFRDDGYVADVAHDGQMALRLFRDTAYDIVVTDLLMPDCDGLETIRAIRDLHGRAAIIAISGGGSLMDCGHLLRMAGSLGADAIMAKPFTPDRLVALAHSLSPRGLPGVRRAPVFRPN